MSKAVTLNKAGMRYVLWQHSMLDYVKRLEQAGIKLDLIRVQQKEDGMVWIWEKPTIRK